MPLSFTADGQALVIGPDEGDGIHIVDIRVGDVMRQDGGVRLSFPGGSQFQVGEDDAQLVHHAESQGFTRVSLSTGDVLGRVAFHAGIRSRTFAWSSRQGLLAVVDDSAAVERIVVLDSASGDARGSSPPPAGVECWQLAFTPHRAGSILAATDDGMIRDFRC